MVIRKSSCTINCRSEPDERHTGCRKKAAAGEKGNCCIECREICCLFNHFLWFALAEETLAEIILGFEYAGLHKHASVQEVTQTQTALQGLTGL